MFRRVPARHARIAIVLTAVMAAGCSADVPDEPDAGGATSTSTAQPSTAPTSDTVGDAPATTLEAVAPSDGSSPAGTTADVEADLVVVGHTDVTPEGNRFLPAGRDVLAEAPIEVQLGFEPAWIVPVAHDGVAWAVIGSDGSSVLVAADGTITPGAAADPTTPPIAVLADGSLELRPATDLVDSDVPFARPATLPDGSLTHLDGPTTRYPHGVLGTDVEAERLVIGDATVVLADDVFEAMTPMVTDIDGDGTPEVLATQSNADDGATLVAYRLDGTEFARTGPVGQGNRWRHQIAVAPFGPDGEIELIEVRTPHIGGVVQVHQLSDERLARQATLSEHGSHVYGSPNLGMAVVFDADADGAYELAVPTQNRRRLALIARVGDGLDEEAVIDLPDRLTTNLGAALDETGQVRLALGTADGTLLVWP